MPCASIDCATRVPSAANKNERQPAPGLIHHSDRGIQYACADYLTLLAEHGVQPSMSRVSNPYDNSTRLSPDSPVPRFPDSPDSLSQIFFQISPSPATLDQSSRLRDSQSQSSLRSVGLLDNVIQDYCLTALWGGSI